MLTIKRVLAARNPASGGLIVCLQRQRLLPTSRRALRGKYVPSVAIQAQHGHLQLLAEPFPQNQVDLLSRRVAPNT